MVAKWIRIRGRGHFSGKSALSNSISGNDYDFPPIRRSRNNFFVSKLGRIRFPRRKKRKKKEYRSLQLRKKYGNGFVRIQRVSLWLTWSCVRFSGWKYFRSCTIFLLFFSSSLFYVIFHGKLRIISARRTVIIRQTRDNRVTNHSVQSQFLEERFHFWKISSCRKQASAASSDANSSPNKNSTLFLPLEEIHRGITNVQYYLMRDTSNILA